MGMASYEFRFTGPPPSQELVARRLQERTGLELRWEQFGGPERMKSRLVESCWSVSHPSLKTTVEVRFSDQIVSADVLLGLFGTGYLFWCVAAVLAELGGSNGVEKRLPRYASVRWPDKRWWQWIPR